MKFEFNHRNHDKWLLLLPGWSFTASIFSTLDLPFNYIVPDSPVVSDIADDVAAACSEHEIRHITILGWSLGATCASLIAARHPGLAEQLVLVSVMEQFPAIEAARVKAELAHDWRGMCERFHRMCFTGQKDDFNWFVSRLQQKTLVQWTPHLLARGIDFISGTKFEKSVLASVRTICFHGSRDIIAPLAQTPCGHGGRLIVIKGAGHLPFLHCNFKALLEEQLE